MSYPLAVDSAFIPTLKMELAAGHNFTGRASDSLSAILNQTAIRQLGLKAPYPGREVMFAGKMYSIIGVVKDFNFQDLHATVSPLIFYVKPSSWHTFYIRADASQMKAAIAAAAAAFKPYKTADKPFAYQFLDKQFEHLYKSDRRTSALFTGFASIAVFIACLGLFGLATYSAEARIKEIGIRKVLGASVSGITRMICKEFIFLVLLAIVIATPVSYLLSTRWLHNFAYQSGIGGAVFFEVCCGLLLLTVFIIGLKVYSVAAASLVRHLKSE